MLYQLPLTYVTVCETQLATDAPNTSYPVPVPLYRYRSLGRTKKKGGGKQSPIYSVQPKKNGGMPGRERKKSYNEEMHRIYSTERDTISPSPETSHNRDKHVQKQKLYAHKMKHIEWVSSYSLDVLAAHTHVTSLTERGTTEIYTQSEERQ